VGLRVLCKQLSPGGMMEDYRRSCGRAQQKFAMGISETRGGPTMCTYVTPINFANFALLSYY
jgi:hypothetical protein